MPSLGADMESATLVEWLKKPGDRVHRGDVIAAVETQKGAIEIEGFVDGTLVSYCVDIGQKVPVGTVLALIRADGETTATLGTNGPIPVPAPVPAPSPAPAPMQGPAPGTVAVTPAARRLATTAGLDPTTLHPDAQGVVGLREVEDALGNAHPATRATANAVTLPTAAGNDGMRHAIAAAMSRSWREIPHYYVASTLDLEPLMRWLEEENRHRPVAERLLYAAPITKAVARALAEVPGLNGHYRDDSFVAATTVHLGIAIALRGGGLVAPAMMDAHALPLPAVMAGLTDLVSRARGGRLRSGETGVATATLTNLGENSADQVQGIIHSPQVAIIGCGRVREIAWSASGVVSSHRAMTITVGGDHRASDGRTASRFLIRLAELLDAPETL